MIILACEIYLTVSVFAIRGCALYSCRFRLLLHVNQRARTACFETEVNTSNPSWADIHRDGQQQFVRGSAAGGRRAFSYVLIYEIPAGSTRTPSTGVLHRLLYTAQTYARVEHAVGAKCRGQIERGLITPARIFDSFRLVRCTVCTELSTHPVHLSPSLSLSPTLSVHPKSCAHIFLPDSCYSTAVALSASWPSPWISYP